MFLMFFLPLNRIALFSGSDDLVEVLEAVEGMKVLRLGGEVVMGVEVVGMEDMVVLVIEIGKEKSG